MPPPPSCRRWPTSRASPTCARHGAPTQSSTGPTTPSRSAAPRCSARATDDAVTLVGAGVTLHESLAAADLLAADGIAARVVDCYSVKPIDTETLAAAVRGDRRPGRRHRGPLPRRRPRRGGAVCARRRRGGATPFAPGRLRALGVGHARRAARPRRHLAHPHRRGRPRPRQGLTSGTGPLVSQAESRSDNFRRAARSPDQPGPPSSVLGDVAVPDKS